MGKSESMHELWEARSALLQAVRGLSEAEAGKEGSIGAWSVKDVVAHIIFWDEEFLRGLKTLRSGGQPEFLDLDWDETNAREVEKRKGIAFSELLEGLTESGRRLQEYLDGLDESEFSMIRGQKWKTWDVTVDWIIEGIIGHDRHHSAKIISWHRKKQDG